MLTRILAFTGSLALLAPIAVAQATPSAVPAGGRTPPPELHAPGTVPGPIPMLGRAPNTLAQPLPSIPVPDRLSVPLGPGKQPPLSHAHGLAVQSVQPFAGATGVRPDADLSVQFTDGRQEPSALESALEDGHYAVLVSHGKTLVAALTPRAPSLPHAIGHASPAWGPLHYTAQTETLVGQLPMLTRYTTYTATLVVGPAAAGLAQGPALGFGHPSPADAYRWSFTTGSAIGEPTHLRVVAATTHPIVTQGDRVAISVTDDYGDPATMGTIEVQAQPAGSVHLEWEKITFGSASNGAALTERITDHTAQTVTLSIETLGPWGSADAHSSTLQLSFQPGAPALLRLDPVPVVIAGGTVPVAGVATDVYGNPVSVGTGILLHAGSGTMPSVVSTTAGGAFEAQWTAPRVLTGSPGTSELVPLTATSGMARAETNAAVSAGPPAAIALAVRPYLSEDTRQSVSGTVYDRYGNAVANGTVVTLSVAGPGRLAGTELTTAGGAFATSVTTGSPGPLTFTASAGQLNATALAAVIRPVPEGSRLDVVATPQGEGDGVSGTLTGPNGEPVSEALVRLSLSSSGSVRTVSVLTNALGAFTIPYTLGDAGAVVTAVAGSVQSSVGLWTSLSGEQSWTATGIDVSPGAEIHVSATGDWASALCAKVGSTGSTVALGGSGAFVSGAAGTLYLGPGTGAAAGTLNVVVTVTASVGVPTIQVAADPTTLPANGSSQAEVSGSVYVGSMPVVGALVQVRLTGSGQVTLTRLPSSPTGQFSDTFTAGTTAGATTITASWDGVSASTAVQLASRTNLPAGDTLAGSPYFSFVDAPEVVTTSGSTITITKPQTEATSPLYPYAPSGADILYGNQYAPYTITLPSSITPSSIGTATLIMGAVLDDHSSEPLSDYHGSVLWNGVSLFAGIWPLSHGEPYDSTFTNWQTLRFNVTGLVQKTNHLTIVNDLGHEASDWLGVDAVELVLQRKG